METITKCIHTMRRDSQPPVSTRRRATVGRVVVVVCLVAIIILVIRSVMRFMHGAEPVTYRGSQNGLRPKNSAVADGDAH